MSFRIKITHKSLNITPPEPIIVKKDDKKTSENQTQKTQNHEQTSHKNTNLSGKDNITIRNINSALSEHY
jgi:hypothetical protein